VLICFCGVFDETTEKVRVRQTRRETNNNEVFWKRVGVYVSESEIAIAVVTVTFAVPTGGFQRRFFGAIA